MKLDTNNEVFKEARSCKRKSIAEIIGKGLGIFIIVQIIIGFIITIINKLIFKVPMEEFFDTTEFMLLNLFGTGILTAALIINTKISKEKTVTLGFTKHDILKEYSKGILIGIVTMCSVVLIGILTKSMTFTFNPDFLKKSSIIVFVLSFIGFLIQGMSEEVFVRGYFLVQTARKKKNVNKAVYATAILFASLHLFNEGITFLSFINLILFGILAAVIFIKTGNIWQVSAFHSIWNFLQGNVFGILVSGQSLNNSLFICKFNKNMTLLNGGTFGAEGGLIVTVVYSIIILYLLKKPTKETTKKEA